MRASGDLDCLGQLRDVDGVSFFGPEKITSGNFHMEFEVNYLGEPRPTSLDAFITGDYQVAIECKLTESVVGPCSRPLLNASADSQYCDGRYAKQRGRTERCALTEIGVHYWKHIPELFSWNAQRDISPCPGNLPYQLVRNVLAACSRSDQSASPMNGHALLIFDERNPSFSSGKGSQAFEDARRALTRGDNLRRLSWQRIAQHLKANHVLDWMTVQLDAKYGIA